MPKRKINQLTAKVPVVTDLLAVADPVTGIAGKVTFEQMLALSGGQVKATITFYSPLTKQRLVNAQARQMVKVVKDSDIDTVAYRILPNATYIPLAFTGNESVVAVPVAAGSTLDFSITFSGAAAYGAIGVVLNVI